MTEEEEVPIIVKTSRQPDSGGSIIEIKTSLWTEVVASTDIIFQKSRLNWLLLLGPLAVVGDAMGFLGEALCFCCAGAALIPCAERLSFVTEQVAEHTNGTIGALLNATFGNAPELLISVAALRSGFYRVVQLAMLGSMLTNLMFVFGVSCLIGGLRWQVQELRMTSGNVNVVMLLVATAGTLFPAALVLSGQFPSNLLADGVPSPEEIVFCRVNAVVMLLLYVLFLTFQLGTHKEEFDDEAGGHSTARSARKNLYCIKYLSRIQALLGRSGADQPPVLKTTQSERILRSDTDLSADSMLDESESNWTVEGDEEEISLMNNNASDKDDVEGGAAKAWQRRRRAAAAKKNILPVLVPNGGAMNRIKSKNSETVSLDGEDHSHQGAGAQVSLRCGIVWLFIITVCISAISDILVGTIDGFAKRMHLSEVFTSMVIIPFFSNVAEQVSAFIFAYKNEMDLCVGVTVGSAIQIATFVLPGSVLIGMVMDRSMTLYFHGYETTCLVLSVITVAAILQGGTTNWLTGAMLVGIYVMFAAGIWLHDVEDLTIDAEIWITNSTQYAAEQMAKLQDNHA